MFDELISAGLSTELIVVIMSALPVTELRGALPVAIRLFYLPWYRALYLAIIGNLIPVPLLLMFFNSLAKVINRTDTGTRLLNWLFKRTGRGTAVVEKYKSVGLMVLVAIPVPGTGAWTGSVVAVLCGLKFGRAFLSVAVGVAVSGAIVTVLSLLGWPGAIIAGVGLSIVVILGLWKA